MIIDYLRIITCSCRNRIMKLKFGCSHNSRVDFFFFDVHFFYYGFWFNEDNMKNTFIFLRKETFVLCQQPEDVYLSLY